ncbi:helix-turn-helix domain-containing protein [Macrococcus armenti]|uniref:helix-turn-helix domain-containing protein n=1 Tax=Macrococcus armenti TaxID=2875764 RepID=UPI001CCFDB09|nr:helix-turn-helix transcriptional regulator [Macrococcus armenti]UBH07882.1 helix-turn-helix transcriptional regulator [Macrococcus armenti]
MNTYDIVKKLVNKRKMSIAELERKLDLSNGQIKRWEKSAPNGNHLKLVADYFDVSVDYLLDRKIADRPNQSEDILIMHRAAENMSEEQRKKALVILETMFDDWEDITKE